MYFLFCIHYLRMYSWGSIMRWKVLSNSSTVINVSFYSCPILLWCWGHGDHFPLAFWFLQCLLRWTRTCSLVLSEVINAERMARVFSFPLKCTANHVFAMCMFFPCAIIEQYHGSFTCAAFLQLLSMSESADCYIPSQLLSSKFLWVVGLLPGALLLTTML